MIVTASSSTSAADTTQEFGDVAVKGIDREPTNLLNTAAEAIKADVARTGDLARSDSARAVGLSILAMLGIGILSLILAILMAGSMVQPLAVVAATAQAVARGISPSPGSPFGRGTIAADWQTP